MVKRRVIVLDSNSETLRQMKEYFDETKFLEPVYMGDDGELGIERSLELKPDLLIVNMFLKGSDGCGVIRSLKKSLPKLKILATGNAGDQIIERAITSGADYYLV